MSQVAEAATNASSASRRAKVGKVRRDMRTFEVLLQSRADDQTLVRGDFAQPCIMRCQSGKRVLEERRFQMQTVGLPDRNGFAGTPADRILQIA